ncbi:HNH endonuclease [Rhizobiaceae bacterium LC148]|nr:HNH endonuclease [Rhizobiaceae bacterium LC148]
MVISDYHRAFVEKFGRSDVSLSHLHSLRKRKGWKVGRGGGRYLGRLRKFSEAEIQWLRENRTMTIGEYHRAFSDQFGRDDVTAENLHALRKRQGWKTGRTGQFEKGAEPVNKGKTCPPGVGGRHPNAQRTQFRKGQVPHTFRGAGHERIDTKDGYVVIIVDEENPWTGAKTRPVHKHRWLWEKKHGPIPDGFVLKCLDGDKTNCDPSNWELIPREVLPHLTARFGMAYDQAEPELKPTIMAVAKLKHAVKKARERKSA